jgi:hypothetical protein
MSCPCTRVLARAAKACKRHVAALKAYVSWLLQPLTSAFSALSVTRSCRYSIYTELHRLADITRIVRVYT